ncbi:MAG: TrkH family potassium uptake protein [Lachnospiraceae bacterium]|uniref:TrkH family potassium uptake protein n=1 Tax=Parablautia sp. Marseille-Q6255 TaxID=3039593 RepID=UPI0024BC2CB6|nr:TrkH family potassium uptake protein [Parablautia sp. Marseille-Q6255]
MNYGIIIHIIGWVLNFEAAFMIPALITALLYKEKAGYALLITILLCLGSGMLLIRKKVKNKCIYAREGFVAVALCWIALSAFGALPFVIAGSIPSYIDALFEVVSGFTTTGSSILPEVESMPKCLLFWRSFTHWIGGMGVLVLVMAILPLAGGSTMYLMKAESPGPSVGKLVPKVKSTALLLYKMYVGLSVLQLVLLLLGGMPVFDSLTTMFGTAGTGGFGIKNDSIGSYSVYLQVVVTVFMILFGVNFNFYYLLLRKKWKEAARSSEVWTYLAIILASIILITINVAGMFPSGVKAFQQAAFQVGSIITTTGFATTDFELWPQFSKMILVLLMLIGACAGSTGGGIKVSRIILLFKSILKELDYIVHPHNVRKVKMDGRLVEHTVMRAVNVFLVLYLFIFAGSVLLISLDNFDFTTNFTAVAATLNNIGPGLGMVGPTGNFGMYSDFSKLVLTFDMLVGRLELFPILILFSKNTWTK